MAGPAGDGREGPGQGVGEKEDIVSPTLQLPEVSWHKPISLAVSSDTVPSPLTAQEMHRTGHRCLFPLLVCPQTRVRPSLKPSSPLGVTRRGVGGLGEFSALLPLLEKVQVDGSVALSAFTSVGVRVSFPFLYSPSAEG